MNTLQPDPSHHYHFVTGRLAEAAVRQEAKTLASRYGFSFSVGVMPITVAALMTPRWLRRHLDVPADATHVILPGYCEVGVEELTESLKTPVIVGPKDCRTMSELFGEAASRDELGPYDIELIAEINHVPRRPIGEVVRIAQRWIDEGADRIDIGCDPSIRCKSIGDYVAAVVDLGVPASIDTFDTWEAAEAIGRGASLVLSVSSVNVEAAVDWGCEVVAIPDAPGDQTSFEKTIDFLTDRGIPMRLDPILEPIGAGLMESLIRYATIRDQFPDHEMMMGIGNVTELSDVDSAGVNLILLAICQELRIRSVLTTEVINWARSSVRECDIARRLVHYSLKHRVPPKRLSDELLMLRDPRLLTHSEETLQQLAESIRDNNYRIFAQDELIHLMAAGMRLSDRDPFRLFEQLMKLPVSENVDPGHAFYLGFEMAKASLALLLGKQYDQDQPLRWGFLTPDEDHHRLARRPKRQSDPPS
jgi:dihydropteroate synthase-like protein